MTKKTPASLAQADALEEQSKRQDEVDKSGPATTGITVAETPAKIAIAPVPSCSNCACFLPNDRQPAHGACRRHPPTAIVSGMQDNGMGGVTPLITGYYAPTLAAFRCWDHIPKSEEPVFDFSTIGAKQ